MNANSISLNLFLIALFVSLNISAADTTYTTWKFNELSAIGNQVPIISGNPILVPVTNTKATWFDGVDDKITISENPLIGLNEFTFEVIFRVDEGGAAEQKFLHMQADPDIRILFELEFVNDTMWYMENYIQSGTGDDQSIHLQDNKKLYAANKWYHAAVVYKNNEFKQYINYRADNTGSMTWNAPDNGAVAIGARMNDVNYMKGAVKEIRFSDAALAPEQFLKSNGIIAQCDTFLLDNLTAINGYDVEVFGNPQVVETDLGPGIEFDGVEDGIYIKTNPLGASETFTIETIIQPYDVYPNNIEPRYLHIEDPDDSNRRITMELRLNATGEWYFDGFIKSPVNNLTLIDDSKVHPINDSLLHLAITYGDGVFKTYANGVNELSGEVTYEAISANGQMSVGMRMNKKNYFSGVIHAIRITHAILQPEEFMEVYQKPVTEPTAISQSLNENNLNLFVWPNPVVNEASIGYQLNEGGYVDLSVYTATGAKVKNLVGTFQSAGNYWLPFETDGLNSGVYIIRLRTTQGTQNSRVIIQ